MLLTSRFITFCGLGKCAENFVQIFGKGEHFFDLRKPPNCLLATLFPAIIYVTEEDVTVGPVLHEDNNLTPLSLRSVDQLHPILSLYADYTGVSGLNINIHKTTALCINTPVKTCAQLWQLGMTTHDHIKHLGLHLSTTILSTVKVSMSKIEPKLIKRRILATTPPTDTLHRATLVNMALLSHLRAALDSQDMTA
jgi:hypothetical protein